MKEPTGKLKDWIDAQIINGTAVVQQAKPILPTTDFFIGLADAPTSRIRSCPPKNISEKEFTQQVIDLAHLCGWTVAHFRPARVKRGGKEIYETPVAADGKGWLDLFMVRRGERLAMELKVGRNKPTAEQKKWLTLMNLAGIPAAVYRPKDWQELEEVLK